MIADEQLTEYPDPQALTEVLAVVQNILIQEGVELKRPCTIAGGAIANILANRVFGTKAPIRDLDVFEAQRPIPAKKVVPIRKAGTSWLYHYGQNVLGLKDTGKESRISIIQYTGAAAYEFPTNKPLDCKPDITKLLDSFDLNCTRAALHFPATGSPMLFVTPSFTEFLKTRCVKVTNTTLIERTLIRFWDKVDSFNADSTPELQESNKVEMETLQLFLSERQKRRFVNNRPISEKTIEKFQGAASRLQEYFKITQDGNIYTFAPRTPARLTIEPLKHREISAHLHRLLENIRQIVRGYHNLREKAEVQPNTANAEFLTDFQHLRLRLPEPLSVEDVERVVVQQDVPITKEFAQRAMRDIGEIKFKYICIKTEAAFKRLPSEIQNSVNPTAPCSLPPYDASAWSLLHGAAFHRTLADLPTEWLTMENLSRAIDPKDKTGSWPTPLTPLNLAKNAYLLQLPPAILMDSALVTNEDYARLHWRTLDEIEAIPPSRITPALLATNIRSKQKGIQPDTILERMVDSGSILGLKPEIVAKVYEAIRPMSEQIEQIQGGAQWLIAVAKAVVGLQIEQKARFLAK